MHPIRLSTAGKGAGKTALLRVRKLSSSWKLVGFHDELRLAHFTPEWLILPLNSAQDARQFVLAFFRSCTDRMAHFTPEFSTGFYPRVARPRGCSPILFWRFFRYMYRPNGSFYRKQQHRTLTNFCLALFAPCSFTNVFFRGQT